MLGEATRQGTWARQGKARQDTAPSKVGLGKSGHLLKAMAIMAPRQAKARCLFQARQDKAMHLGKAMHVGMVRLLGQSRQLGKAPIQGKSIKNKAPKQGNARQFKE
jgi:hypothetical protein